MDSGFGAEDGYNLYDTRLFEGAGGRDSVYRPRNNAQASPSQTLNPEHALLPHHRPHPPPRMLRARARALSLYKCVCVRARVRQDTRTHAQRRHTYRKSSLALMAF